MKITSFGFGSMVPLLLVSLGTWYSVCAASANVVGYVNIPIYTGDNLIANQLDAGANTLNDLFPTSNPNILDGTTFRIWDTVTQSLSPVSTYDSMMGWSINYNFTSFATGAGGVLNSPSPWTWTSVGNVVPYSNIAGLGFGSIWNPNYSGGQQLIACPVPVSGTMDMMFTNVVGRLPQNGESVQILNAATQTSTTTTFHTGTGWDNGDPGLAAGQAAWFTLVPEPSSVGLLLIGVTALLLRRRPHPVR